MAILIERDEGTAARRRIPFRLFTSDGTTPDTGALNDAVIVAVNSSQTFSANSTARALESAQGMYWLELTASEVSVLGTHALYHTVGSFPQHVATFNVVNFNPYSTQSNLDIPAAETAILAGASADSVWDEARTAHIAQDSFGGILQASTVSRLQIAGTTTEVRLGSGETTLDDFYNKRGIALQYTNGDWITNFISDYTGSNRSARLMVTLPRAPESGSTYILLPTFESLMTVTGVDSAVTIRDAEYSAVTVRLGLITYSGATVGINNATGDVSSRFTVGVGAIDRALIAGSSADSVWDEARTDHRALGSFGGVAQASAHSRLQIAGTTTEIRLGSGETTRDDFFNNMPVAIQYTSGDWIANVISDYTGSNQSARLRFTLPLAPESASTYVIGWPLPLYESLMTPAGALQPTVVGRTLDVTATGAAGVDWANVEGQTTEVNLSGTTIRDVTNPLSIDAIAAGTYSDVTITGVQRLDSAVTLRAATHSGATVGGIATAGIVAASFAANAIDAVALATDAGQEIADRLLTRNVGGGSDSGRTVSEALYMLRNRVQLSSTSLIVYQTDDTTIAWFASKVTSANHDFLQEFDPA